MGLKVVVTGASSRIGRVAALRFARDGHDAFITGRSESNLKDAVTLAEGTLDKMSTVDSSFSPMCCLRNYKEAIKALGHIDVLVLNGGLGSPHVLEEFHVAEYDLIFNTNVREVSLWLKTALPEFKKRKFGQMVTVNSVAGLQARVLALPSMVHQNTHSQEWLKALLGSKGYWN